METIRVRQLDGVVNTINKVTGNNENPWTKDENGKFTANIGSYVLDGAYGGYQLQQIVSVGGGVRSITQGYLPKREVYYLMHAYLNGLMDSK